MAIILRRKKTLFFIIIVIIIISCSYLIYVKKFKVTLYKEPDSIELKQTPVQSKLGVKVYKIKTTGKVYLDFKSYDENPSNLGKPIPEELYKISNVN